MTQVLHLDGSQGEGGGRILRTALSLALLTGQPFHPDAIRARIYGGDGKKELERSLEP